MGSPVSTRNDLGVGALAHGLLEQLLGLVDSSRRGVAGESVRGQVGSVRGTDTLASDLTGLGCLQAIADGGTGRETLTDSVNGWNDRGQK